MKLVNFASLDPFITSTGRKGLSGASKLDREIWDEFHADWENLAIECVRLRNRLLHKHGIKHDDLLEEDGGIIISDFEGKTRKAVIEQRTKQDFFRRAVLSSYRGRCCMSGVSNPRLLVASHIVPWSIDKNNRLNPRNGLCLSAIHDKAFDKGLITLSDDLRVVLSAELRECKESFIENVFLPISNKPIEIPDRFAPDAEFVNFHRSHRFLGA